MSAPISTGDLTGKLADWAGNLTAQAAKLAEAGNTRAAQAASYRSDLLRVAGTRLDRPARLRSIVDAQVSSVRALLEDERFLELSPAQIRDRMYSALDLHEGMSA